MFVCGVPKDADAFSRLFALEQNLFGALSVPAPVAREIYDMRPEAFCSIVDDKDSSVAAYSIAYPLQAWSAQRLIEGEISEPELRPDMLLRYQDAHDDAYIYVGSVVVAEQYDGLTKANLLASLLSWRSRQLRDAAIRRLSIVMVGVSDQGERLIRYVGAKKLREGFERKDGYPVYGRRITRGFLLRATNSLERCINSRIVAMDYSFKPAVDAGPAAIPSAPVLVPDCAFANSVAEPIAQDARRPEPVPRPRSDALQGLSQAARDLSCTMGASVKAAAYDFLDEIRHEPMKITLQSFGPVLLVTLALLMIRPPIVIDHPVLVFLPITWLAAVRFGGMTAIVATAVAALASSFFFYAPFYSLYMEDPVDVYELAGFVVASLSLIQLCRTAMWRFVRAKLGS